MAANAAASELAGSVRMSVPSVGIIAMPVLDEGATTRVQTVALKAESKDIVDTAVAAGSFKTLVAAVQAATRPLRLCRSERATNRCRIRRIPGGCGPSGAARLWDGSRKQRLVLQDLLRPRIASGDQAAVPECISRYGGRIWSLARRQLACREDAEDVVQPRFPDRGRKVTP